MTDPRHAQPRCPICRFPYRPNGDGCEPGNCSFRPADGSPEYIATLPRFEAYDRLRAAGNDLPTLEDVDAELQPKGLPVIAWDRKTVAWLGDWHPDPFMRDVWRRLVIEGPSRIAAASVFKIDDGFAFSVPVYPHPAQAAYPTPEAAQAACEAAIVAAWRSR